MLLVFLFVLKIEKRLSQARIKHLTIVIYYICHFISKTVIVPEVTIAFNCLSQREKRIV